MKNILRKPAVLILSLCIAVSACLCGCGANLPVSVSDAARSALELCNDSYTDSELDDIYSSMNDAESVRQLNDSYAIECLRQDDDGYQVIYEGNKRVLVLRFDKQGNWIKADRLSCLFRMTGTRGKFDALEVGDNVTEVQKIDPTCYFPFFVEDAGDNLVTRHYTEDGYVTTIRYDTDFNITSVSWELM